ncbi:hypothetical protein Flexsi_1787 [Flexistipes sinusarabici DSM 4947]|uniref:Lipoprotein n=1 Tax=Flexistipes sinusarabici (strain ATCC 49648 / DSM 4947 / MAS 10) TaxID=717231 RepID=F8EA14_FLESM|nr:hypothetical protein [Flexistipes sinusarabici]AEI15425.1 hypothetical protein Flexsi_1787 [Flexistipes sinusarabici DSM 4947]
MKKILSLIFISLFFVGCAKIVPYKKGNVEQVHYKSYKIGDVKKTYVGNQIIEENNYTFKSSYGAVEAKESFTIEMSLNSDIFVPKDVKYDIIGGVKNKNGDLQPVVSLPSSPNFWIVLNQDNEYAGSNIGKSFHQKLIKLKTEPMNPKFKIVKDIRPIPGANFVYFELVYTGKSNDSVNILYREYNFIEQTIRPAFNQKLTYPVNVDSIRFRNFKFKVLEVNDEYIKTKLVSDK